MAKYIRNSLLLTAILTPIYTSASDTNSQQCDNTVTEQCLPHTGWFIGGFLGSANTDVNKTFLNQQFEISRTVNSRLDIDDDDNSIGLSAGYRFNPNIAVELSYYDFGKRNLRFQGSNADVTRFANETIKYFPSSGEGLAISGLLSYPIDHQWAITGRLGLFNWEHEFKSGGSGVQRVKTTRDGLDIIIGAELSYHWRRNTQLYLGFDTVDMGRHRVNNTMLGLRYFFGNDDQPKPNLIKEPEEATLVVEPPLAKAVDKDSDKDGVLNSKDQCPGTEPQYQVDIDGCTIIEELEQRFSLNIQFGNDSSRIPKASYEDIAALAKFMKKYQNSIAVVEGHTSSQGPAKYNQKLSEQRAKAVVNILNEDFAINNDRLSAVGYGEERLLTTEDTEQAHHKNRRIEINVTVMTKSKKTK